MEPGRAGLRGCLRTSDHRPPMACRAISAHRPVPWACILTPCGSPRDPDDVLCDLLSRTQMMCVDALSVDLSIPPEELGPRLESLMDAGVVGRRMKDDGPVDDHHWVHLSFHGEQQLTTA